MNWAEAEAKGLVTLEWIADEHVDIEDLEGDSFNPKCHPDMDPEQLAEERKEFIRTVEREGVWGRVGKYRLDPDSEDWENGDSVWGFVGFDACGYEDDIKAETLAALLKAMGEAQEERDTLREVASAVCAYKKSTERAKAWALKVLEETAEELCPDCGAPGGNGGKCPYSED